MSARPTWSRQELWELAKRGRPAVQREIDFAPADDAEGDESLADASARFLEEMEIDAELVARKTARARRHAAQRDEAFEAWRFVAIESLVAGHHEMLPMIAWMLELAEGDERDRPSTAYALAPGVHHAAMRAHERPDDFAELARDPRADIRRALATGLVVSAERTFERDLLRQLAGDHDANVRDAARRNLGVALPWWHGRFPEDPATGLDPNSAAALQVLRAAYDESAWSVAKRPIADLLAAASAAGDRAAVPLAGAIARSCADWPEVLSPLLVWLAGRAGAAIEVVAVIESTAFRSTWVRGCFDSLPTVARARRMELSLALCDAIVRGPAVPAHDRIGVREAWAAALAKVWPTDADPEPVLAALLGGALSTAAERRAHRGLRQLDAILDCAHPALDRHRAAIERAIRDGLPGAWCALPQKLRDRFAPPTKTP